MSHFIAVFTIKLQVRWKFQERVTAPICNSHKESRHRVPLVRPFSKHRGQWSNHQSLNKAAHSRNKPHQVLLPPCDATVALCRPTLHTCHSQDSSDSCYGYPNAKQRTDCNSDKESIVSLIVVFCFSHFVTSVLIGAATLTANWK